MASKQAFDLESAAQLARIALSAKEKADFAKQLGEILGYFSAIGKVKVQSSKFKSSEQTFKFKLRNDEPKACLTREEALKNAPAVEEGYVKVRAVFDQ